MTHKLSDKKQNLQLKVDGFIRDALAEKDNLVRAKLLGKATYWNSMAMKADTETRLVRSKPVPPHDVERRSIN